MGDFLTRFGVNFLNHKLKITRGGIEIDNGNVSGSVASTGSFGYLNVDGDTVIGGNLTLGDAATDSISFSAEINSNLIPDADSTYNIGSTSKNWKYGYIEEFSATNITGSGNISGSVTSTGSLGYLNVDGQAVIKGMANSNLVNVSSSISTRVSNLKTDSGSFSTRVTDNNATGSILAGTGNIQGLGSTNNVQFNHITASGNISASGTIYADNFQSVGGDSAGISFTDDLNITGHITASKNIKSAKNNRVISV